jgi:hypothetical protein
MTMANLFLLFSISLQKANIDINRVLQSLCLLLTQLTFPREQDSFQSPGERLRRVFLERGVDFFHQQNKRLPVEGDDHLADEKPGGTVKKPELNKGMTSEELSKMRVEILPQL